MDTETQDQEFQVTVMPKPAAVYVGYAAQTSRVLGITLIVTGIVNFIANLAAIMVSWGDSFLDGTIVGQGIWGSILFFVAGSYAIQAARLQTHCLIKASMVLNILGAICAAISVILGVMTSGNCVSKMQHNQEIQEMKKVTTHTPVTTDEYYNPPAWPQETYNHPEVVLGLVVLMILVSVVQLVVSVWAARLGHKVLRRHRMHQEVVTETGEDTD